MPRQSASVTTAGEPAPVPWRLCYPLRLNADGRLETFSDEPEALRQLFRLVPDLEETGRVFPGLHLFNPCDQADGQTLEAKLRALVRAIRRLLRGLGQTDVLIRRIQPTDGAAGLVIRLQLSRRGTPWRLHVAVRQRDGQLLLGLESEVGQL